MRYIFDTNAFYYYLTAQHNLELPNITINKKIDKTEFLKFIESNKNNLCLSAVSVWELTTRFRNHPSTIIDSIHICEIDKIKICTNACFDISSTIMGGLANPKANRVLVETFIKNNYVPQRAKFESWFLTNVIVYNLILFIQLHTQTDTFLKNFFTHYSLESYDFTVQAQVILLLLPQIMGLAKTIDDKLFKSLQLEGNLEKIIKKEFEDNLFNCLVAIYNELPNLKLKAANSTEIDFSKLLDDSIISLIKSTYIKKENSLMLVLHKLAQTKNCDPDHTLLAQIMQKRGFTKLQMDYFQVLITDWYTNGKKMRKNDIDDFLFIGFIGNKDLGITFDKKVANFLSLHHAECGLQFYK